MKDITMIGGAGGSMTVFFAGMVRGDGYTVAAFLILLLFYGIYIGKMTAQRKKGIRTDQIGKKGFVFAAAVRQMRDSWRAGIVYALGCGYTPFADHAGRSVSGICFWRSLSTLQAGDRTMFRQMKIRKGSFQVALRALQ